MPEFFGQELKYADRRPALQRLRVNICNLYLEVDKFGRVFCTERVDGSKFEVNVFPTISCERL